MNTLLSTSFSLLVAEYREHLAYRNLAVRTIKEYPDAIVHFLTYLESVGVESVHQVTLRHLNNFVGLSSHLSAGTRKGKVDLLRSFFRFLKSTGKIPFDLSQDVISPKLPKRLPKGILDVYEVNALLKQPDLNTYVGARDRAILELAYGTGLRSSEICGLTLGDVDLVEQKLHIIGKGNKEAYVPFGKSVRESLEYYLNKYRIPETKKLDTPALFLSYWKKTPITSSALLYQIKLYAKKAGIEKNVIVHGMRHSCATHLIRNGAPLMSVQGLLRHVDISSTQKYTHLDGADVKEAQTNFHPREQALNQSKERAAKEQKLEEVA